VGSHGLINGLADLGPDDLVGRLTDSRTDLVLDLAIDGDFPLPTVFTGRGELLLDGLVNLGGDFLPPLVEDLVVEKTFEVLRGELVCDLFSQLGFQFGVTAEKPVEGRAVQRENDFRGVTSRHHLSPTY
jgi:hypothetical protein